MSSIEMYPGNEPAKKLGEAMEKSISQSPEAYEKAAIQQHELEANTFGGPLAPGEAPAEINIGYLAKEQAPKPAAEMPEITIDLPEAAPSPMKLEMANQIQKALTPEDIEKLKTMGPQHAELDPNADKKAA